MTIAELHGKISGSGSNLNDRLEDLLTSDVFGGLLYAASWEPLEKWLVQASNIGQQTLKEVFPEFCDICRVVMVFWPSGGCLRREPDVVLRIETTAGKKYGLCFEAKYLSGKSNRPDEAKDEDSAVATIVPGDQLAAQWTQVCEDPPPKAYPWSDIMPEDRVLVFVTAQRRSAQKRSG